MGNPNTNGKAHHGHFELPAHKTAAPAPKKAESRVEAPAASTPSPAPVSVPVSAKPAVVAPPAVQAQPVPQAAAPSKPEPKPAPDTFPEALAEALKALQPLRGRTSIRWALAAFVGFVSLAGMVVRDCFSAPHETVEKTEEAPRIQTRATLPIEPRKVEPEREVPRPHAEAEPESRTAEAPLTLKAPALENPSSIRPSARPTSNPSPVEKTEPNPEHPSRPAPTPARPKVSSPAKAEIPIRKPVTPPSPTPGSSAKSTPHPSAVEVVEPEEKAKQMAEARKLYLEAFAELKTRPADARAKFEKVMQLAGPNEPLWTASLKLIQQIDDSFKQPGASPSPGAPRK